MPATLYLTPSIAAARVHLANEVAALQRRDRFTPVHILLPTAEATRQVRRSLGDVVAIRLLRFPGLCQALLDQAAAAGLGDTPRLASNAEARRVLRLVLDEMHQSGELSTFAPVRDKPGMVRALLDWLAEVQSQAITQERLEEQARRSQSERDRQLGVVYRRYTTALEARGCADQAGLPLATARVVNALPDFRGPCQRLFVLGFDQFSPARLALLAALAKRLEELAVYLLWDESRERDDLALSRLRSTRESLRAAISPREIQLTDGEAPPSGLAELKHALFQLDPAVQTATADGSIHLVAAPSREAEVRWVIRHVKRLLLEGRAQHDDILVAAPRPATYRHLVRAVAEEYGVQVHMRQPLLGNPAVAALFALLELAPDFPRRAVLDALRCPYTHGLLDEEQIGLLDRLTRERPVLSGKEQWLDALQPVPATLDHEDEDRQAPLLAGSLTADELAAIRDGLERFFSAVTPPAGEHDYGQYSLWLQHLILGERGGQESDEPAECTEINIAQALALDCDRERARRDQEAIGEVLSATRRLQQLAAFALRPGGITWEQYRAELQELVAGRRLSDDAGIRFGALDAARGVQYDHVFVLGLAEGEFPGLPAPDPLYSPAERQSDELGLLKPEPAASASLWWQVVSCATRQLTVLRPRFDENGALWAASPYWQEIVRRAPWLHGQIEQPPAAGLPAAEDAASEAELLTTLAATGAAPQEPHLAGHWRWLLQAQTTSAKRASWAPPGEHEGVLRSPGVGAILRRRFGPDCRWSASRLGLYGTCPYRFFARAVLALEPRQEPEFGMDSLQRGSLLHAVLENLYGRLTEAGLWPCPAQQEEILRHLDAACEAVFAGAPLRYHFRPGALWQQEQEELRRLLRALVKWECCQMGLAFHPYLQETRFGEADASLPPLTLKSQDGTSFLLRGIIDRIDQGGSYGLRVIDYKTGSSSYSRNDMAKGLAFQACLYAVAAERLLQVGPVRESRYLHIPSPDAGSPLVFSEGATQDALVQQVVDVAARFIQRIQSGLFPCAPAKACPKHCEYAGLCRADRHAKAKARQVPSP
jgi:RecB family exonuclease